LVLLAIANETMLDKCNYPIKNFGISVSEKYKCNNNDSVYFFYEVRCWL